MLAPVVFVARSQRRSRRVALVGLAVFVGVTGALSLSFIAGARRSSSVVDRFFAAAPHYDATVYSPTLERSAVLQLPGVQRADPSGYLALNLVDANGEVVAGVDGMTADLASTPDPTMRVLKGALPDGSDSSEVVVNEHLAQNFHVSVGGTVMIRMFSPEQADDVAQGIYSPEGPTYVLRVVGIVRPPNDIAVDEARTTVTRFSGNEMVVLFDFWQEHHHEFLDFGQQFFIVLADGLDGIPAVDAALTSLAEPGDEPPVLAPDERFSRRASYTTPVGLETTALLSLGVGVAIAAFATAVLVLRTEQRFHDRDATGLRVVGLTAPQLATIAALRTLPAALAGGAIAVMGAVGLSSRFPIGTGRQLELHPGVQANIAVLVVGGLLTVVLITGVSVAASRSWRRGANAATASRFTFAQWLRRAGAPIDVALGAHLAFETPKGRRSITAAQGVVGGVAALVVVGTVAMWVGGVDRLYNVPARHGWAWDAAIGNTNFELLPATADRLAADPRIAQQTRAAFGQARLGNLSAELFAIDGSGTALPVIVAGRLPTTPSEIALGTRTLHRLGADIGGTVTMSLADSEFRASGSVSDVEMTVVGTALAPMFGESDVGDVSVVTLDAIRDAGGDPSARLVMVRFAGTDRSSVSAQIDADFTEDQLTDIIPARIVNMHNVRRLPQIGIYLAGALGTLTLAYVVLAGARSHRRDLAVLRAIGLEARRIRKVVLCQGALTALAMVTVGLPLSLLAGAGLWRRVVDNTGVEPGSVVPPAILLVIPAALAVAVCASLFAALRVGHSRVAEILREE